jgi:hypothetical protein
MWIEIVVATLTIFGLVTLAMSIGALLGRSPLKGSCGGPGEDCPCSDAERRSCARRVRDAS